MHIGKLGSFLNETRKNDGNFAESNQFNTNRGNTKIRNNWF